MQSQVAVPVPTGQFLELVDFLRQEKDLRDPVEVVSFAIQYFLDNASWKPDDLFVAHDSHGYQWKNLFLPHGTQIRMPYKGKYFYAKVEGDEVVYNGTSMSPGSLANLITGTSRNAWRDLWIKRPEEKEWKLAQECRHDIENVEPDQALNEFLKTRNAGDGRENNAR